ncbi:MAG: hypothetical protein ACR2GG_00690 [Gemmatimonadaceae bacterium]
MSPSNSATQAQPQRIYLRLTWQYLAAFAALTILCGTSHEFVHHFTGAAICGRFGLKTFNSFDLAPGCDSNPWSVWATVAGPLFTFALMWWGLVLLRSEDERRRRLGFALIFANFPVNRMGFVLFGSNDEQWVARQLFGHSHLAFWATILIVWAACVPPLVAAYRAIGNRHRPLWFAGFFLLPFAFVIVFAGVFLENYLLLARHVLATRVLGVPYLIILVEVLSLVIYRVFRAHLTQVDGRRPPRPLRPRAAPGVVIPTPE